MLDLVGKSTVALAMLRRGGLACLAGWLGDLAPIADLRPVVAMAGTAYLTFLGIFVFGKPDTPIRRASPGHRGEPRRPCPSLRSNCRPCIRSQTSRHFLAGAIAAGFAADSPADPQRLARSIADLDSEDYSVRKEGDRRPRQTIRAAEAALRKALADPPPRRPGDAWSNC